MVQIYTNRSKKKEDMHPWLTALPYVEIEELNTLDSISSNKLSEGEENHKMLFLLFVVILILNKYIEL